MRKGLRPVDRSVRSIAVSALLSVSILATGCTQEARSIAISEAWAPATPPNATVAAAYMRIEARDGDVLLGASSPAAARVEMHRTSEEAGMMKMRPIDSLIISTQPVALSPNGAHFMLIDLKAPLAAGTMLDMTLRFERAGEVPVEVAVVAPDADHANH